MPSSQNNRFNIFYHNFCACFLHISSCASNLLINSPEFILSLPRLILSYSEGVLHMARTGKNTWALFLLLLAGIVLGSFIAQMTEGISGLSWLSFGKTFGLDNPITLNLGVLILTFGLKIKFTIASIIGIVIAGIIYRFL